MPVGSRLVLIVACLSAAQPLRAQGGGDGALASLLARDVNREGPFAQRGLVASDAVVQRARAQLGRRYRYASSSPDLGFDCSGLVKYVLQSVGITLPHNAERMAREGEPVLADSASMRPGDLLMFGRGGGARISHVGIYVGDGMMIHASTSQRRVVASKVHLRGSSLSLRSVRRVLRDSTTARTGSD